jgi:hypothetical protein
VAHVTALGQLRGNSDHANPVRFEHVGIFFDVKRSGEATHRPHLRIPPFSAGRRALSRFSKQQGPGSLRSFRLGGDGTRWVGDVYFLLDGGMAHTSLHKAFQSKDKGSKSLTVLKDVNSVDSKHERVRISGRRRPC